MIKGRGFNEEFLELLKDKRVALGGGLIKINNAKKSVLQHNQDDLFPPLTLVTWCCYNVWFQPSVILSSQTVLYSRIMVT